ncbi:MAG TPA: glutamate--tRNA ligase [Acidimicrobiales bacterium]|nr:glutamate--tRNA ligase [Acidimicrobiales bacterium]
MPVPRVRFAPSPTGFFHVGSGRTALYNWLFARRNGGVFILRIEDTDTERNREEWVDGIIDAMAWLGMAPDEGPYRQSQRSERYQAAIDTLWDGGFLYACECTSDAVRSRTAGNATPGYDGFCRDRGVARAGNALRFRTPDDGETQVDDVIRGTVTFRNETIEDFVVARSNGEPLFVLANIVDDRDMKITHVIRGEELLPSAPKAILIWRALDAAAEGEAGWGETTALPVWAHLPTLVNEQRQKLSKRRDPVAVESYRDQGYLAEALRNYLALLGWSPPGGEEKVELQVLVDNFALEDVNHSPAFFDVKKLAHMNGEYIRDLPVEEFVERVRPWVDPAAERAAGRWLPESVGPPPWPEERFDAGVFLRLAPLVRERIATMGEAPALVDFMFLADPAIDAASWDKAIGRDPDAPAILAAAIDAYERAEWAAEALREATLVIAEEAGKKLAKAQAPIRVAVTGRTVGPPLFESLELLGRDEVVRRLRAALDRARSA